MYTQSKSKTKYIQNIRNSKEGVILPSIKTAPHSAKVIRSTPKCPEDNRLSCVIREICFTRVTYRLKSIMYCYQRPDKYLVRSLILFTCFRESSACKSDGSGFNSHSGRIISFTYPIKRIQNAVLSPATHL